MKYVQGKNPRPGKGRSDMPKSPSKQCDMSGKQKVKSYYAKSSHSVKPPKENPKPEETEGGGGEEDMPIRPKFTDSRWEDAQRMQAAKMKSEKNPKKYSQGKSSTPPNDGPPKKKKRGTYMSPLGRVDVKTGRIEGRPRYQTPRFRGGMKYFGGVGSAINSAVEIGKAVSNSGMMDKKRSFAHGRKAKK